MTNVDRVFAIAGALVLGAMLTPGAAKGGQKTPTTITVEFQPGSPVPAGTAVTVIGHVATTGGGDAVTAGKIQISELMLGGAGVPCGTADADWVPLNPGGSDVDSDGNVSVSFDTTGLSGFIGFAAHYVPSGGADYEEGWSDCSNLKIGGNTCTNVVGAPCCSFTQGAYGNEGSAAMCMGPTCNSITGGQGLIPALASGVFNQGAAPNATTIGIYSLKSVTLADYTTLLAYLPGTGTPGSLTITGDNTYSVTTPIPGGGFGGGTLASQTMTSQLNAFISGKTVPGFNAGQPTTFTIPAGFSSFTLPAAGTPVCTMGAGGTIRKFTYPACVAGQTIGNVQSIANIQLATGSNAMCTPGDLTTALDNMNKQFDECAVVIACPQ
ncbi:MAG: hypothetical protein M1541_19230 [Acidobacteria bacterium]|nr:hypothetical protein [Acidobacteriota bacterium]